MQTMPDPSDIEIARQRRSAARFFWCWLVTATAMSVTGNVAHAVLHADSRIVALAAGAALVPPVVLLAATHSIAVLVRTRAGGLTYWCAMVMTFVLAACAFVLSFDALRSLAITLGLQESIAWLWPCAIDVAIAQATLCLLSLSRRAAVREAAIARPVEIMPVREPVEMAAESDAAPMPSVTTADIERWRPVAESLVLGGVTAKPARLVATILALREAGASATDIGRHHDVHHTTVGKIVSAAEALAA